MRHTLLSSCESKRKLQQNQKHAELKQNRDIPELTGHGKSMHRGKFMALDGYAEEEKLSVNNLIFHHKYQKEEQVKPKAYRKKEITKIKEAGNRKTPDQKMVLKPQTAKIRNEGLGRWFKLVKHLTCEHVDQSSNPQNPSKSDHCNPDLSTEAEIPRANCYRSSTVRIHELPVQQTLPQKPRWKET